MNSKDEIFNQIDSFLNCFDIKGENCRRFHKLVHQNAKQSSLVSTIT